MEVVKSSYWVFLNVFFFNKFGNEFICEFKVLIGKRKGMEKGEKE